MAKKLQFKDADASGRFAGLRRLAFNKWTMTFMVMLLMLSVYVTLEEPAERRDVLYVTDTLPYDVQKVNGEGGLQVLSNDDEEDDDDDKDDKDKQKEQNNNNKDKSAEQADVVAADSEDDLNGDTTEGMDDSLDVKLDKAGQFSINSDGDFFINYRLEREKARARQLELLQGLIDDGATSDEIRAQAQQRIIEQAEAIEQELLLESILVAKYGGEAAVFMQPGKANAVLSLNPAKMTDREAEKIAVLIDSYTGIGYENVVVVLKD